MGKKPKPTVPVFREPVAPFPFAEHLKYEYDVKCSVCLGKNFYWRCTQCYRAICNRCGQCSRSCEAREERRKVYTFPAFRDAAEVPLRDGELREKRFLHMSGETPKRY